jgi:hypothetical protein
MRERCRHRHDESDRTIDPIDRYSLIQSSLVNNRKDIPSSFSECRRLHVGVVISWLN